MRQRYPSYYYLYLYLALLLSIGGWYLVYTNTKMMKKYPTHYYFWLFLALLLSILFWVVVLWKLPSRVGEHAPVVGFPTQRGQVHTLPDRYYRLRPIDRERIIRDSISHREIVSDLVNIAIKDTTYHTHEFVKDFEKKYDPAQYPFSYIDSTLNYMQVKVPEQERARFKQEIKQQMKDYDLLVWDEALFHKIGASVEDANHKAWQKENLYPLRKVQAQHLTVAVIDNGFDLSHPSLKGKSVKPYNATNNSTDVSPAHENHGTAVASLIMGERFQDIEGLVPTCRLMPIKVADSNDLMASSYLIKAILYAIKNKADVVNLSLGANLQELQGFSEDFQRTYIAQEGKDEEAFWKELFGYAQQNKTIIVIAAGNDNVMTGFDPFQRAETTIKVGATTLEGQKASFSNYGEYTTLYAQGEDLKVASTDNQTEVLQGTSFSAPIVSAFVIALKTKYPDYDSTQLIAELLKNTENKYNLIILHNKTF